MENIGPHLFSGKEHRRFRMNINYKDLVRWRGRETANKIYEDYKSGKIKTMDDLLVHYGIKKREVKKKYDE